MSFTAKYPNRELWGLQIRANLKKFNKKVKAQYNPEPHNTTV